MVRCGQRAFIIRRRSRFPGARVAHRHNHPVGLELPLLRGLELAQRAGAPQVSDSAMACADVAARFGLAALFLLPMYGRELVRVSGREWSQAIGLAFFCRCWALPADSRTRFDRCLDRGVSDAALHAGCADDRRGAGPAFPSLRVIIACVMVLNGAALLSPGLLRHFILGPVSW